MMNRITNPYTRHSRIANAAEHTSKCDFGLGENRITNPYTRHSRIANAAEPQTHLAFSLDEFAIRPQ
jgi:hypothetical protein